MFSIFAFADIPDVSSCSRDDDPSQNDDETTTNDDVVISRSIHDEELAQMREATRFPSGTSTWVRRATSNDLPVFGTISGAFAYEGRR